MFDETWILHHLYMIWTICSHDGDAMMVNDVTMISTPSHGGTSFAFNVLCTLGHFSNFSGDNRLHCAMPSRGVDRRTKYREQEVAPHGDERRKQLQKIYEKNTTRISHLIYHLSFLTALLIGTNPKGWPFGVWVYLLGANPSYLGQAKPKKTKKKQPVSVGVQAGGDVAVTRLDASVQTDPYEPRLDHQTECLSMRSLALIIIIFWFSRPLNLFRCWTIGLDQSLVILIFSSCD